MARTKPRELSDAVWERAQPLLPRFAAEQRGDIAHICPRDEDRAHARSPDPTKRPLRWAAQLAQSLAAPARPLGEVGAYVPRLPAPGLRPPLLPTV